MKDRRYNKCLYVTCHLKKYAFYKFRAWVVDGLRELGGPAQRENERHLWKGDRTKGNFEPKGFSALVKGGMITGWVFRRMTIYPVFFFPLHFDLDAETIVMCGLSNGVGLGFLLSILFTDLYSSSLSFFIFVCRPFFLIFITRGWERRDEWMWYGQMQGLCGASVYLYIYIPGTRDAEETGRRYRPLRGDVQYETETERSKAEESRDEYCLLM